VHEVPLILDVLIRRVDVVDAVLMDSTHEPSDLPLQLVKIDIFADMVLDVDVRPRAGGSGAHVAKTIGAGKKVRSSFSRVISNT
jgi:hypothetical protein